MSFKEFNTLLEETAPSSSRKPSPRSERLPVVLVIDDDKSIRTSLECLLSSRYHLIVCATAIEGVDAFNDNVSAVILDIKMDIHDGFWACDQIRKRQADIPVIFYSAYQDAKDPYQIINQHRPFGYIMKDGDPRRLLNTLETAVLLYQSTIRTKRLVESLKRPSSPPSTR